MEPDEFVQIDGIEEAKEDLHLWGFGDLGADALKEFAVKAASVVLDEMKCGEVRAVIDLKKMKLTYWPFSGDFPRVRFDIIKIIEDDLHPEMYGPNTLRAFAEKMRALAKTAEELAAASIVADDEDD